MTAEDGRRETGDESGRGLKQRPLFSRGEDPQMTVGQRRCDAPPRRPLQEARLNEVRLVQVFERPPVFTEGRRDRVDPDRSAAELLDDGCEDATVELVETVLVHLETSERLPCRHEIDLRFAGDLGEVAEPTEQPVGDAWRAAAARSDLAGRVGRDLDPENPRRAHHDPGERLDVVEVETECDPETAVQRL